MTGQRQVPLRHRDLPLVAALPVYDRWCIHLTGKFWMEGVVDEWMVVEKAGASDTGPAVA